jgi:hypothetical protein
MGKIGIRTGIWWKTQKENSLVRPRRRWEDNIKMDLRELGYWGLGWIHRAQSRDRWGVLVNTVMNLRVPCNVREILE